MEPIHDWQDAFGNQVSARTNVLDLAAHYPYSPIRWRLFVDGSRAFPEYGSVPQYSHDADRHKLQPAAGETVTFESTERPRYVVQYELAATFAFELNQELQSGDLLRVGLYDGEDGWYIEQDGTHDDDQADIVMERDGSEVYRSEDLDIREPTTTFARLKLQTGWYDVTRQLWERSIAESASGKQRNKEITREAAPGERGPRTGNLPVHFSVTASASTTGLTLSAGSAAQVNLGTTTQLTRDKKLFERVTLSVTDSWEPLLALRVDPDREIVDVQVEDFTVRETTTGEDSFALLQSFAPEKVADSGGNELTDADFSTPTSQSATGSVIQTSTAVDQVADSSGTLQTSMTDPGGYQIQASALYTGTGQNETTGIGPGGTVKRLLSSRDIAVVLVKSSTTGDVAFDVQTEQDW